jgi:hypothetical protein
MSASTAQYPENKTELRIKVDVTLEFVVVFFKTSGCAVGSSAGVPDVLLGTVDQEVFF